MFNVFKGSNNYFYVQRCQLPKLIKCSGANRRRNRTNQHLYQNDSSFMTFKTKQHVLYAWQSCIKQFLNKTPMKIHHDNYLTFCPLRQYKSSLRLSHVKTQVQMLHIVTQNESLYHTLYNNYAYIKIKMSMCSWKTDCNFHKKYVGVFGWCSGVYVFFLKLLMVSIHLTWQCSFS